MIKAHPPIVPKKKAAQPATKLVPLFIAPVMDVHNTVKKPRNNREGEARVERRYLISMLGLRENQPAVRHSAVFGGSKSSAKASLHKVSESCVDTAACELRGTNELIDCVN